jgi:hypothetical protein
MEFKIYPMPTETVCTPYVLDGEEQFSRLFHSNGTLKKITLSYSNLKNMTDNAQSPFEMFIGRRLPNREELLHLVHEEKEINPEFLEYVKNTIVVPTYSISENEILIKTIIRQLIHSIQAKKLYSVFIRTYGIERNGIFGFPDLNTLISLTHDNFRDINLGMKAKRVVNGINELNNANGSSIYEIHGIGPWSKAIIHMEKQRDYSLYPFWDKSGKKIDDLCGIDLIMVRNENRSIVGDLYIYGASFLESRV